MSRGRRVCVVGALLLGMAGLLLAGCHGGDAGGSGGGGGGGNATVPLGNARLYAASDNWDYALTGTFVAAGGGTTPITPTTSRLVYDATSSVPGSAKLTLTVPVAHGAVNDVYVYSVSFTQNPGTRTLTLTGLSPMDGNPAAFDTPIVGPNATNLAGVNAWGGSANVTGFGAFQINSTKQATETVTALGEVFECYRVTGSKSLDGFPSTFTVWLNPQLGAFVKMTTSYTDVLGTTDLTYLLNNTNVPLP